MTRDELRQGLVRLAAYIVVGISLVVVGALALWAIGGGGFGRALALAFFLAAALLVVAGAVMGLQTGSMSMDRDRGERRARYRSDDERKEHERLAVGLFVAGVGSFLVAMILG